MAADELLTVEEVARYLRVHEITVQRWCRTGTLPAAKIGRAYRIRRGDLETWWSEHVRGRNRMGDAAEGLYERGFDGPTDQPLRSTSDGVRDDRP
jgi:nitrogen PTS system EIIA component